MESSLCSKAEKVVAGRKAKNQKTSHEKVDSAQSGGANDLAKVIDAKKRILLRRLKGRALANLGPREELAPVIMLADYQKPIGAVEKSHQQKDKAG